MSGGAGNLKGHVVTVAAALVVSIATAVFILAIGGVVGFGGYQFKALVPTAQDVYPGATVRIVGLEVGKVNAVEQRDDAAILTLEIDEEHAPVHEDDRVEIRLRTLAGENYVELYQGGDPDAQALAAGDVLPMSQSIEAVEIDQVLSVLDPRTRARAQQLIEGVGSGLDQRGEELNEFIRRADAVVEEAEPVASILAGRRQEVARVVENLDSLMRAVGDREAALVEAAQQGRATAEALARRDRELRRIFTELPSTLTQVGSTTEILRDITPIAAPVLTETAATVRDLDEAVALLEPAARRGRALTTELELAAPKLEPVLREARRAAKPLAGALPELHGTLCEAAPAVRYLKPYRTELTSLIALLASGTNFYNATGHAARIHGLVGENTPVFYDPTTSELADRIFDIGTVTPLRSLGYNPYPKPGAVEDLGPGSDATGPGDSSIEFPRVEAEC